MYKKNNMYIYKYTHVLIRFHSKDSIQFDASIQFDESAILHDPKRLSAAVLRQCALCCASVRGAECGWHCCIDDLSN